MQVEMGDGAAGTRRVLADVSNQLGKRRFVSISGNSATSSEDGCQRNTENEVIKSNLPWCISGKGSENLFKGKYEFEFGSRGDFPLVKPKKLCGIENFRVGVKPGQENAALGTPKIPSGSLKVSGLFDRNVPFPARDVVKHGELKKSDSFTKSFISSVPGQCNKPQNSLLIATGQEHHGKETSCVGNPFGNETVKKDVTNFSGNKGDREDIADLTSKKSASTEFPIPTGSSDPQESESVKCTAFTGDGSMGTSAGEDFLNSCSCSFCCKAAYIWSDLHYQDIKGRIAALKKSRKEVKSIVDRRYSHGGAHNVQGNLDKSVKLEFDLMGQWRSLFLHSEDILVRENNKLQSSLLSLKELRDNCKDDLEALNATSS